MFDEKQKKTLDEAFDRHIEVAKSVAARAKKIDPENTLAVDLYANLASELHQSSCGIGRLAGTVEMQRYRDYDEDDPM